MTTRLSDTTYQTAELLLRHNRAKLVRRDRITPQWIDGGRRFAYTVDPAGGLILVDPQAGTREPIPDLDGYASESKPQSDNPLHIPSPNGEHVVFVRDHNLWVRSTKDGDERALTVDGDADHEYGANPDYFMYAPMIKAMGLPHLPPAVAWSPDSTRILVHRTNQTGVRRTHLIESAPGDGAPAVLHTQRYAFPGDERLPLAEYVVIDLVENTAVRAQGDGVAMPMMSPLFAKSAWWAEDSSAVYYLSQPRDLRALRLHRLDPATGEVSTLLTETGDTRVEPGQQPMLGPQVRILSGGDRALWFSERDGWGHLYVHDLRNDTAPIQLTSGKRVVQQILHVDEDAGVVYLLASGYVEEDPYRRSVCRVGLDGDGFARVTEDDLDHAVTVSANGAYFIDAVSTNALPPVTTVRDWQGRVLVELEQTDITALTATGWTPPERFRVKGSDGDTDVYGLLHLPHDFDPAKTYPVIDHLYANPAVTRVNPSFDPGWHGYDAEAVAALGFVVLAIDGRGTPGRGKAFHDAADDGRADAGCLSDHEAALRQLAVTRPWMDLDRVGAFGISAGGVSTVRLMLDFPETYTVGVAESGNHDNGMYNPGWVETYDRLGGADTYASNVDNADRLAGKLMLVHGGMDNNVLPDHALRLADRLIAADKDFDLLIVPGAEHVYVGYEHYVQRRKWDYLVRNLLGVEPPATYRLTPVPPGM